MLPKKKGEKEMKKNLIKITSVLMVLVMAFALTACKDGKTVAKFVEETGATLESAMEAELSKQGIDCDCKVSADGTKLVVVLNIAQFDQITAEQKKMINEQYKSNEAQLMAQIKPMFKDAKDEVKDLSAVVYSMRDSKGGDVFTMTIPMD